MSAKKCGAKTRAGHRCRQPAMPNGRCRMHGGKSTGAPKGNKNAVGNLGPLKHGFYSNALLPEEQELYSLVEIGSLNEEIRLAKVKLFRFVRLSGSADLESMIDGALEVVRKRGEHEKFGHFDRSEIKAAAPDYADLIIRQLDIIRKLELAQAELQKAEKGDDEKPTPTKIVLNVVDARKKPDEPDAEHPTGSVSGAPT